MRESWAPAGVVVLVATMLVGLAATAAWSTTTPFVLATAISLAFLGLAAVVDVRERRLPNALVGAALVPVAVAALAPAVSGSTDMVTGALAGAAVLGGPLLLTHLVSPAGMGFGDVKAGAVLGAALGLIDVQVAVLALLLALAGSGRLGRGPAAAHDAARPGPGARRRRRARPSPGSWAWRRARGEAVAAAGARARGGRGGLWRRRR